VSDDGKEAEDDAKIGECLKIHEQPLEWIEKGAG
jgi:hypothetical protein